MEDNTSPLTGEHISFEQGAGLLSTPPEPETPAAAPEGEPSEEAAVEAVEATEATTEETIEDTEDTEPEAEELPAIDPPASWKQADRDRFSELPRELQQTVADRERSRETITNQKLQEAAETRKTADAEKAAAAHERQAYQQQLEYIVPALQNGLATEFSDIKTSADVMKLAQEEPDRYAVWRANQDALQIAQAEQRKVQEQRHAEQAQAQNDRRAEAEQRLVEAFPEWGKDIELGKREIGETHVYLRDEYSVPAEVLAQMTEPYQYKLVKKAMAFDRAQRAKAKAVAKVVPKVQRPGTPQGKGQKEAEGMNAKLERLDKSGDFNDALALIRK